MPELPEVETIRRDLEKNIVNKKISNLKILNNGSIKNSKELFFKYVKNNKFIKIDRIGKLLIFKLTNNKFLLIHLKMTGQLVYELKNDLIVGGHSLSEKNIKAGVGEGLPNKHTRAIFKFSDKSKLFFNDLRKFGYLKIVDEEEFEKIKKNFGIEPLKENFTFENFKKTISNKKISVKSFLLNQKNIAGIGNIYADEILFASGIRPDKKINSLNREEILKIFKNTEKIIKKAIELRGTTFSNYVDGSGKKGNFSNFLKVYGRDGKKCLKCGNVIKKIKFGGRGTHFCSICQKITA